MIECAHISIISLSMCHGPRDESGNSATDILTSFPVSNLNDDDGDDNDKNPTNQTRSEYFTHYDYKRHTPFIKISFQRISFIFVFSVLFRKSEYSENNGDRIVFVSFFRICFFFGINPNGVYDYYYYVCLFTFYIFILFAICSA